MLRAADRCVDLNLPFALFAMPGEPFRFYASRPDSADECSVVKNPPADRPSFLITFFGRTPSDLLAIPADLTAEDVLSLPAKTEPLSEPDIHTIPHSTPFFQYYAQAGCILDELKHKRLLKCVLSRRIALASGRSASDIAQRYFAACPDTLRALYYTRESGLWIVATPELLLEINGTHLSTMSLAGSRPAEGNNGEWSLKNQEEHSVVTRHILDTLESMHLHPDTPVHSGVQRFGEIEHLADFITCECPPDINHLDVADRLSPTPAIAGMPVDRALALIDAIEPHHRYCYGGWIGLNEPADGQEPQRTRLYVNLRTALLSTLRSEIERDFWTDLYDTPKEHKPLAIEANIFVGGGLMADSVITDEWIESGQKAAPLYNAISDRKSGESEYILTLDPENRKLHKDNGSFNPA